LKKIAIEDDMKETEGGVPCSGPLQRDHHSLKQPGTQSIKVTQEKANSRLGSGLHIEVGSADMKNILGFLNQNEWIFSLNIGNIM
jgi:hypothetical protein